MVTPGRMIANVFACGGLRLEQTLVGLLVLVGVNDSC